MRITRKYKALFRDESGDKIIKYTSCFRAGSIANKSDAYYEYSEKYGNDITIETRLVCSWLDKE